MNRYLSDTVEGVSQTPSGNLMKIRLTQETGISQTPSDFCNRCLSDTVFRYIAMYRVT